MAISTWLRICSCAVTQLSVSHFCDGQCDYHRLSVKLKLDNISHAGIVTFEN